MPRDALASIGLTGWAIAKAACLVILVFAHDVPAEAGERGMLWRVVQACVANHRLTGAAFPCLDVDLGGDPEKGYVVLKAPFEASHVIVSPAVHTTGIEAPQLRAPGAPNYFADAWRARRFVDEALSRQPARGTLGMAVNSRAGRSQDQLHIHIDCLRPDIRASLDRQVDRLRQGEWTDLILSPRAPRYAATVLDEAAFARTNVIALAQAGLGVPADEMDGLTMAVAPVAPHGVPGFAVLARRRLPHSRDEAHGEALLDHSCAILR